MQNPKTAQYWCNHFSWSHKETYLDQELVKQEFQNLTITVTLSVSRLSEQEKIFRVLFSNVSGHGKSNFSNVYSSTAEFL